MDRNSNGFIQIFVSEGLEIKKRYYIHFFRSLILKHFCIILLDDVLILRKIYYFHCKINHLGG